MARISKAANWSDWTTEILDDSQLPSGENPNLWANRESQRNENGQRNV
jgi:hypothetical protein